MAIWVSSLAEAPRLVRTHRPARVVSLLSPHDSFPAFSDLAPERHLKLPVHDIVEDLEGMRAPSHSDAETLLAFLDAWDRSAPLVVHCWAGISRSTATAFIAACMHAPAADEAAIARKLREVSSTAAPNRRLVAHADKLLNRDGRMVAAIEAIGRGVMVMEAQPFVLKLDHLTR